MVEAEIDGVVEVWQCAEQRLQVRPIVATTRSKYVVDDAGGAKATASATGATHGQVITQEVRRKMKWS